MRLNYSVLLLCVTISAVIFLSGCQTHKPDMVITYDPYAESALQREIKKILQGQPTPNAPVYVETSVSELGFIMPVQGEILERKGVEGITIKATEGQIIRAVKSGLVTFVSDNVSGYGKTVAIKHSDGFLSIYAYNSDILVKKDQAVKQGDPIAAAGKTGRATQPSLNFRLFKNDTPVNPLNYLP